MPGPGAGPRHPLGDLMKKQVKKLVLAKETVRDLESKDLEVVAGGGFNTEWLTCTSRMTC
jgi:hypothetical protein